MVGDYVADLFVENTVIVEIKVAKDYNREDEPQLLNELKATGIKVGLLVNFGRTKVEFKRMVLKKIRVQSVVKKIRGETMSAPRETEVSELDKPAWPKANHRASTQLCIGKGN